MKITNKANRIDQSYTIGNTSLIVDCDDSYTEHEIVINTLATGTVTARAKVRGADSFESVVDGSIDLTANRSLIISGRQIDEIELTVSPDASFDAVIYEF